MISIVSKLPNGHRRAGVVFGAKPVTFKDGELSKEQLEAIKADPNLIMADGAAALESGAENRATDLIAQAGEKAKALIAKAESDAKAIVAKAESDAKAITDAAAKPAEKPASQKAK